MNARYRAKHGFTLVELLVVIAIIGILVALLLPAVQAAREAARRMQCGNNLKQIGLSLHNYHDTYKTFPPDAIWHGNVKGTNPNANTVRNYTWIAMVLPFIEQGPLHDSIDFSRPAWVTLRALQINNAPALELQFPAFTCPTDPQFTSPPRGIGITSYAGNAGWDHHRRKHRDVNRAGVFSFYDATRLRDILDGTSNTVMVGEVTTRGYCCRRAGTTQWNGGAGRIRHSSQAVSRTALIATSAHSGWNHSWVREEGKGNVLRADGSSGALWGQWTGPNHLHPPTYYDHYAMNVEWPGAGSLHKGGAQFTLADASVRFISNTVATGTRPTSNGSNGNVWVSMHTIEGGPTDSQVTWE